MENELPEQTHQSHHENKSIWEQQLQELMNSPEDREFVQMFRQENEAEMKDVDRMDRQEKQKDLLPKFTKSQKKIFFGKVDSVSPNEKLFPEIKQEAPQITRQQGMKKSEEEIIEIQKFLF